MFLRSRSKQTHEDFSASKEEEEAKQKLIQEIFGGEEDASLVLPRPEKIVVLLWLYREDETVLQYLCQLVENHVMREPSLVDTIETYLPQLIQLALQSIEESVNNVERLLLILSQLSTRFAIQYHWSLQNLLEDLQLECTRSSGRPNNKFDMEFYARCMLLSGDLERCMSGKRKEEAAVMPKLEITTSHGGTVTSDEVHSMKEESNADFFDAIVAIADDNVSYALSPGEEESVATLDVPLKKTCGGILLFKRVNRRTARRKPWKERYFAIEESMLNCYSRERKLLRSMSLEGANIWKGLNVDRNPYSFVVTNNTTMFHLQAKSEGQKAAWKLKLKEAIDACSLPEDLPESQKERYHRFQNAKWFGRTLTETTNDLECAPSGERSQLLQDSFFELEIPRGVYWPWRGQIGPEMPVFCAMPHFSHMVSSKRENSPRFQASFMLKRDANESVVASRYERFLQEGWQKSSISQPLVIPEEIQRFLEGSCLPIASSDAVEVLNLKDTDNGSTTTGASTDDFSVAHHQVSGKNNTFKALMTSSDESSGTSLSDPIMSSDDFWEANDSDNIAELEETTHDKPPTEHAVTSPINRVISDITFDFADDGSHFAESIQRTHSVELLLKKAASEIVEDDIVLREDDKLESIQEDAPHGDKTSVDFVTIKDESGEIVTIKNESGEMENHAELETDEDLKLFIPAPNAKCDFETDAVGGDQAGGTETEDIKMVDSIPPCCETADSNAAMTTCGQRSSFFDSESTLSSVGFANDSVVQGAGSSNKELVSFRTKAYRQEELVAAQLTQFYESLFATSMMWIRAPKLRRINRDMMIAEVPRHAVTLSEAKATLEGRGGSLMEYFIAIYGSPDTESFQRAQTCFAQSLAGLFLMSHLLGIKNRHDGNLMVDKEGHIFVSDFSCVLGGDAGGLGSALEVAPFKLTKEYLKVMGGSKSKCFQFFRSLLVSGLKRAREDAVTAIELIRLVPGNRESCKRRDNAVNYLRQKLMLEASVETTERTMRLSIDQSSQRSFGTSALDALRSKASRSSFVGV